MSIEKGEIEFDLSQIENCFYRWGKRFNLSNEDIEDLRQDTIIKAYLSYGKWFGKKSLFKKIFNNLIIDKVIRKKNPIINKDLSECVSIAAAGQSRYDAQPFSVEEIISTDTAASVYGSEIKESISLFMSLNEPKSPKSVEDRMIILIVWSYLTMRPHILYKDRNKTIKITDLLKYCEKENYYDYKREYKSPSAARNAVSNLIKAYKDFMHPRRNTSSPRLGKVSYCTLCSQKREKPYLYMQLTNQIGDL